MVQETLLEEAQSPASATQPRHRPLRLLILASKPEGLAPGQRFRLEQWAPRVANEGITLDLEPFESPKLTDVLHQPGHYGEKAARVLYDFGRRAGAVIRARGYDAAIVFREAALIGPAIYERALVYAGVPMFFDFDDAIWQSQAATASRANGVFGKLHFHGKTATNCRLARGIFAGNQYLASYARRYNDNVFVIPTSIELERYAVQPEVQDDSRFVIAWSGSTSTLLHFEHARVALERLAAKRPITVKVICNKPPTVPIAGAENVFIPWTQEGEAEAVGAAHVGMMPLPDDDFTRGKCGLKALQFMATGRPVVVSPVGMNNDLIRHGENGFLASTVDEWVDLFEKLASSRDLRLRIGSAGRKTVEEGYSAAVVSRLFAKAVRQSLDRA